jgi:hypothetical protein
MFAFSLAGYWNEIPKYDNEGYTKSKYYSYINYFIIHVQMSGHLC